MEIIFSGKIFARKTHSWKKLLITFFVIVRKNVSRSTKLFVLIHNSSNGNCSSKWSSGHVKRIFEKSAFRQKTASFLLRVQKLLLNHLSLQKNTYSENLPPDMLTAVSKHQLKNFWAKVRSFPKIFGTEKWTDFLWKKTSWIISSEYVECLLQKPFHSLLAIFQVLFCSQSKENYSAFSFHKNTFLTQIDYPSGPNKCKLGNPDQNISPELSQTFVQKSKTNIEIFSEKKLLKLKLFSGHVKCIFNKPAESFCRWSGIFWPNSKSNSKTDFNLKAICFPRFLHRARRTHSWKKFPYNFLEQSIKLSHEVRKYLLS